MHDETNKNTSKSEQSVNKTHDTKSGLIQYNDGNNTKYKKGNGLLRFIGNGLKNLANIAIRSIPVIGQIKGAYGQTSTNQNKIANMVKTFEKQYGDFGKNPQNIHCISKFVKENVNNLYDVLPNSGFLHIKDFDISKIDKYKKILVINRNTGEKFLYDKSNGLLNQHIKNNKLYQVIPDESGFISAEYEHNNVIQNQDGSFKINDYKEYGPGDISEASNNYFCDSGTMLRYEGQGELSSNGNDVYSYGNGKIYNIITGEKEREGLVEKTIYSNTKFSTKHTDVANFAFFVDDEFQTNDAKNNRYNKCSQEVNTIKSMQAIHDNNGKIEHIKLFPDSKKALLSKIDKENKTFDKCVRDNKDNIKIIKIDVNAHREADGKFYLSNVEPKDYKFVFERAMTSGINTIYVDENSCYHSDHMIEQLMQSIKDTNYNGIVILAKNAAHQHMSTNVYEKMQVDGKTVYNQYSISGKEWIYITKDETKCITENEARTTLNGSYLDNVTINNLLGIGDKKGNHCENSIKKYQQEKTNGDASIDLSCDAKTNAKE